jgi:prepilin-type N-terminal cleavage/methylation domain-containing protein
MRGIRFYTGANPGFTLTECVIAIVILSIVAAPVIQALTLSARADAHTRDIYLSGALIEGIAAQCRFINADELAAFSSEEPNNIWELLYDFTADESDFYCALIVKDSEIGETYTFVSGAIPFLSETLSEAEFSRSQANPGESAAPENYYDLILNEYQSPVYIGAEITGSYRIAVKANPEDTVEIISESTANVYADIYGDCDISYKGGGTLVKTRKSETFGRLYINAHVFSKNGTALHCVALCV